MKTKISATIDPASADIEKIEKMIQQGVSAFRINFSHGSISEWKKFVDLIQDSCRSLNVHTAIIGDLPGPSIRIGEIRVIENNSDVQVEPGG